MKTPKHTISHELLNAVGIDRRLYIHPDDWARDNLGRWWRSDGERWHRVSADSIPGETPEGA